MYSFIPGIYCLESTISSVLGGGRGVFELKKAGGGGGVKIFCK